VPDAATRSIRVLTAAALAALGWSLFVRVAGGIAVEIAGTSFRSRSPLPALAAAAILLGGIGWRRGWPGTRAALASAWLDLERGASWLAAIPAMVVLLAGLAFGTFSASGADAYGYVSQAELWRDLDLHVEQPLAREAPWPAADLTFAPLGYRPAPQPGSIVPTYPPGLPMLMALAQLAAGRAAAFLVVPICGMAVVALSFALGRRLFGGPAALAAACLVAASPVFLFQLVQPMSDVPVTMWWLAAVALAAGRDTGHAALAGLAASAALLTRPNLAALAPVIAALAACAPDGPTGLARGRRALACLAGMAPGAAAVLAIHEWLYGSPFLSGYGATGGLFSAASVVPNVRRYATWLVETQTAAIALSIAAPFVLARSGRRHARRVSLGMLVLAATVVASYVPYAVFEDWWYLRFLLPAIVVLLVLACGVAAAGVARAPAWARAPILIALVAIAAGHGVATAGERGAFALHRNERRYVAAAAYVDRALPAGAVLLAVQHSGSLRYHAGRLTLRWDHLAPAWLDRALVHLRDRHRTPYVVLEDWEEQPFRRRFGEASRAGRLDWPPRAEIRGAGVVRIYDPADRARFLAGEAVRTERVFAR
jgi:4-amino-4-deoxy-L-arabinose transferase-like glycosyltransferase